MAEEGILKCSVCGKNRHLKFKYTKRTKCRSCSLKGKVPWNRGLKGYMSGEKNINFGKFGSDHPKWVENKKRLLDKQIRTTFKYRQWRSDVFTRDDYTCQLCGIKSIASVKVYIEADHYPIQFSQILKDKNIKSVEDALMCEELWNINNGRTLCKKCHDPTRGKRPI